MRGSSEDLGKDPTRDHLKRCQQGHQKMLAQNQDQMNCVDFLTGKQKPNIHKKQKAAEKQPETYSTKLNNELNGYV